MANSINTTNSFNMGTTPEGDSRPEYAPPNGRGATAGRRGILLWGGLLTLALVSLFLSLGSWQWKKYDLKTHLQAELDTRSQNALVSMPTMPAEAESLRFRHFTLQGEYDSAHQVLIDNRVHQERAGYHVLTPLHLAGSEMRVLVNRGWVPAGADHRQVPLADIPVGPVEITGIAVVPGNRFFTLAPQADTTWEAVWQNPDLDRFRRGVPYPLQPIILQLDPAAPGGFVRDWPRPDERADKHLSYALQWFGFAATTVGIWVWFLLRRP